MADQPHTAEHCTIELSHGGTVHVGQPMAEVMDLVARGRAERDDPRTDKKTRAGFITLKRIKGDPFVNKQAAAWPHFEVDALAVIAVFPIDQGSVPIHIPHPAV